MKKCKWILADYTAEQIEEIARLNCVPKFVAAVLISRGLTSREDIERFTRRDGTSFHNPYLLKDMDKAVERIDEALDNGEKITVYGDYDADGITAAYILYTYLKTKTDNVNYYIPDRIDEGYGLSNSAIDALGDTNLIITVDTGITACEQVEYAKTKGIDVIITDHHTPLEDIPDAVAVIDHKQPDCRYPYKELAGVGVALKLAYALSDCDDSIIDKYCHIAAIGTVADLAELTGENRYIVQRGLDALRITKNVGLKALFNVANIEQKNISAATIGFTIGPMLNAAGRVASAYMSLDLLLSDTPSEAMDMAQRLCDENIKRKNEEKSIAEQAISVIDNSSLKNDGVIVVSGEGWHHGVIGIVASRVTERYYRPSVVVSTDGEIGKASCRSVEDFNLFEAISACSDELVKFGGHKMAAGLTIEEIRIDAFRHRINEYAKELLTEDVLTPKLHIDCAIDMDEFTPENIEKLKIFEPYGVGNKTPVFCICGAVIRNIRISKTHAFLNLEKDGILFTVPAFNKADSFSTAGGGDIIDIAGTLNINEYNGTRTAQMILQDWHYSDNYCIRREDIAQVYRILSDSENSVDKEFIKGTFKDISLHKVCICMNILNELDIIKNHNTDGECITFERSINFNGKTALEDSPLYNRYKYEERRR